MAVTDPEQREELARQWMPLLYQQANQLRVRYRLCFEDAYDFAVNGFLEALNSYQPDTEVQFGTLA